MVSLRATKRYGRYMIGMAANAVLCYGMTLKNKMPQPECPELTVLCLLGEFGEETYYLTVKDSIMRCEIDNLARKIEMTVPIKQLNKALTWCAKMGVEFNPNWLLACGAID